MTPPRSHRPARAASAPRDTAADHARPPFTAKPAYAPHPATVVQPKSALQRPASHPAHVATRARSAHPPFAAVAQPAFAAAAPAAVAVPASVNVNVAGGMNVISVTAPDGSKLSFAMERSAEAAALGVGGVVLAAKPRGGWRAMFQQAPGDWVLVTANVHAVAAPPVAVVAAPVAAPALRLSVANGVLRTTPCKAVTFTDFETVSLVESHVAKHGHEVGADSAVAYKRAARDFGREVDDSMREAVIDNTVIKVDPEWANPVRVLIINNHQIRTFYTWDPRFSSDPFVFAIFYTITANRGISVHNLSPANVRLLEEQDVDLFAMEREVIDRQLRAGGTIEDVAAATCAPVAVVAARRRNAGVADMERALARAQAPERDLPPDPALAAAARLVTAAPAAPPRSAKAEAEDTLRTAHELGIFSSVDDFLDAARRMGDLREAEILALGRSLGYPL